MYPVKNWNSYELGYKFREKTFYSSKHLGLDLITPEGTDLYCPFDGYASIGSFNEGGKVINLIANGFVFRFMHLSNIVKTGFVNKGDLLGYTGNTGFFTTGPHLHIDISKGEVKVNNLDNFIDPLNFNWEEEKKMNIDKLCAIMRRVWIELSYNYDQNPDIISLKKDCEIMMNEGSDSGENIITRWSNEGVRKKLKEFDVLNAALLKDIELLKKGNSSVCIQNDLNAKNILVLRGNIIKITNALKEITSLFRL